MYVFRPTQEREDIAHLAATESMARTPYSSMCGKFHVEFVTDVRKSFTSDLAIMRVCDDCKASFIAQTNADFVENV